MTSTELYEIVKDVPRELWPEGTQHFAGTGWSFDGLYIKSKHALWIWEGKLSRFVSETYYEESADKHGIRWRVWHHDDRERHEYPTRIHGLVAAAIERHQSMMDDAKEKDNA